MSHPDDELLADVALDVDKPPPGTHEHLGECLECRRAVDQLRRTTVLLSQGSAAIPSPAAWQSPPPHVWQRVAAAIADRDPVPAPGPAPSPAPAPAPAPAPVPAHRAEVTRLDLTASRRRQGWPWAAGLAAAGLAVGLLTGRALWNETPPPSTTVARAELDTLDMKARLGEAAVVRSDAGVNLQVATTTTLDPRDGYLEVWLINSDGKRMVSVGVLDTQSGTFPISQSLLDQGYLVVDISREPFDEQPEHSGDSLLRGALPAQT